MLKMDSGNTVIRQVKWYHRPVAVFTAILCVGALALPLLWISPAFSKKLKIGITLLVVAVNIWLIKISMDLYGLCLGRIQELRQLIGA